MRPTTPHHAQAFTGRGALTFLGRSIGTVVLLVVASTLASCGGGGAADGSGSVWTNEVRSRPNSTGKLIFSADLRTGLDGFTYLRGTQAAVKDYDGVNLPLAANEPGFAGGRRVKNEFLNSEEPSRWTLLGDGASSYDKSATTTFEGKSIGVLRVLHAEGQAGAPYVVQYFSAEPGDRPPSLFSSRFMLRQIEGPTGLSWTHQGRTHGQYVGSESNSPRSSLSPTSSEWLTTSQTIPLYEQHPGWIVQAPKTVLAMAAAFEVAHMQFEDVTGFKAGKEWSSEYVPSGGQPGIRWFETTKSTRRTCCSQWNPIYGTFNSANQAVNAGGDLTDGTGTPIDVKGLMLEGGTTNLVLWSGLDQVGVAVLDGDSKNYTFTAPATAGSADIYLDPRSGRYTWRSTDIALVSGDADRLISSTTDFVAQGWREGMGAWLFLTESSAGAADGGVQGPFVIASVSQHEVAFKSSGRLIPKLAGRSVNMARIPKPGDEMLVVRNNGSHHRSTVSAVTLPDIPQSTDPDGYKHLSVMVALDKPMPVDGIHGGIAGTNNNLPVYYYSPEDLTIVAKPSNGSLVGTASVTREWARIVEAGLGFQLRNGLVYELKGAPSGNTLFDFSGAAGAFGTQTSASAIVRRVAGSGKPLLLLQSHPDAVPFTNSEFERVEWRGVSKNSTGNLRVFVPPNTTVQVALPQVEQAAVGRQANASSFVVTRGVPASRALATVSQPWNLPTKNARIAIKFTPSFASTDRQTLWTIYSGADSYAEIAMVGSKIEFLLKSGTKEDVAEIDAASGTMLIEATVSNGRMRVAVNGVEGSFRMTTLGIGVGTMQLGALAGSNPAYGAIRNLMIFDLAGAGLS